jgi:uncharacterized protein
VTAEAFFLPSPGPDGGQRFCLFHPPSARSVQGALVYVHPFAEEMNKSRRMAALQSRAFAEAGFAVLQIDLLGCGDSSGDFGDATWAAWVDDVVLACRWVQTRVQGPLWLWGLRAGCLLASEAARLVGPARLLLWQPATTGRQVLQQFLRVQSAGELLAGLERRGADASRASLASGRAAEVAGYRIAPLLAEGLEQAQLEPSADVECVRWLEVSLRDEATLAPASSRLIERWRTAGCVVEAQVVPGPAFWHSTEIEEAPSLLQASLSALVPEATVA